MDEGASDTGWTTTVILHSLAKKMGSGSSTYDSSSVRNREIERQLKDHHQHLRNSTKILLLGPGGSGKSTILKQMRILHSNGFTTEEKRIQRPFIYLNVLEAIISLVTAMESLEISYGKEECKKHAHHILKKAEQNHTSGRIDDALDPEIVNAIKHLWPDPGIQKCYSRRSEYQILDSACFFLNEIDRISASDYLPTQDDILRCRLRTTGVVEVQFKIHSILFRVVDVGGQRSERRKWIKCFDDVKAILFIASLSEYDQKLEEDGSTNCMMESLKLFHWICNHRAFTETSMILFLNKEDILREKITTAPITVAFPEYTGDQTAEESKQFIKSLYMKQNENPQRQVYTHYTCATDTDQVSFIIRSVIDTLVQTNVKAIM